MKKLCLYGLISLVILVITIQISLLKYQKNVSNNSETASYTQSEIYIIKDYNGNVAVYKSGKDTPFQILDCKIKNLPPDAAEALATGIKVSGDVELQKIIEAYD